MELYSNMSVGCAEQKFSKTMLFVDDAEDRKYGLNSQKERCDMICLFCMNALRAEEATRMVTIKNRVYPCCEYHFMWLTALMSKG